MGLQQDQGGLNLIVVLCCTCQRGRGQGGGQRVGFEQRAEGLHSLRRLPQGQLQLSQEYARTRRVRCSLERLKKQLLCARRIALSLAFPRLLTQVMGLANCKISFA